jgi:hypothetical protein
LFIQVSNIKTGLYKVYLIWPYRVMVFNAIFNNISVISWRSVLLVEETGVPRENHWPVTSHRQTLSHNVVSFKSTLPWVGFELTTLVVIGTDCTGSCKFNHHTITTTMVPKSLQTASKLNVLCKKSNEQNYLRNSFLELSEPMVWTWFILTMFL